MMGLFSTFRPFSSALITVDNRIAAARHAGMSKLAVFVSEKEVARALENWFLTPRKRSWSSPIGRVLKEKLGMSGNWKNAGRGDPKKGFAKMKEVVEKKNES